MPELDPPGASSETPQHGPSASPAADVKEAERPESSPQSEKAAFFVVGIGASAGGLEAVSELVRSLPDGMAYVVVQHLAPDHASLLPELLGRAACMPVVTATDGMTIAPHRIHVIPPNVYLGVLQGALCVTPPADDRGPHLAIDFLFRSLAEAYGHLAIGMVLSGTGTDGTVGLKAIQAAGGFTFVQEPSTAKHEGMPRSAIESGAADYCLPLEGIAEELRRIAMRSPVRRPAPPPEPPARDPLAKLFGLVRSELNNDLSQYKAATVDRRIERRMAFRKLERLEDYVAYVQQHRDELHALHKDILISVTRFFRDPEAFEALKTAVFRPLLDHGRRHAPIRVWVPACATGEEAYSIAIALLEACGEGTPDEHIQIFGSDIDAGSIQYARRGLYPASIALDVSPSRLNRFFVRSDDQYQVSRRVRDLVVFSRQNILKDAPFSRVDLVSCRNLLIYLQPGAQQKVLRILHYALNSAGHLLLGSSETVGDVPSLFSAVDRKNKLYARRSVMTPAALDLGLRPATVIGPTVEATPARRTPNLQGQADRKVLELYGPPGVVVSESFDILQFRGHTGPFVDPAPGVASLNILKVARLELHVELRRALQQARSEQVRVTTDLTHREGGSERHVRLDVIPLRDPDTETSTFLVLFLRLPAPSAAPVVSPEPGEADESARSPRRLQELERELAVTQEYLLETTDEMQGALEELKSTNEELQSSNEELQSTNEELETSKEEMQSTNEELSTVNDELQTRMAELSLTNDDLHNVLAGVDNAVVIVGMDLRIRRCTASAEKLLDLVPGDVGRSIGLVDDFVRTTPLVPKVTTVIQTLSAFEEEVLARNQRWYALRITPYKTLEHAIRGALVSLVDIDVRRRAADMTRDVGAYAARFLGAISHPLVVLDRRLRAVWASDAFLSAFQLSSQEVLGSALDTLGARRFADPGLQERVEAVFATGVLLRGYEMRFKTDEGELTALLGASLIPASAEAPLALLSIQPAGRARSRGST